MENDIDIEEHDVLDNPKIRDIFPDLSLVKIEVNEDEENSEQYDESQNYQHEEYHYNIKQEPLDEINYEQNDENIDISHLQSTTDHIGQFEQSDSHHFEQSADEISNFNDLCPNKIILGSKPSYESLYQEALNIKVSVNLEDWGEILKNSPCYCKNCEILFPTVNALDAHKMISHSFLVALDIPKNNTARKSTVPSTYCNHCDKTFPNDTALIKHLYELLPLNNFQNYNDSKKLTKDKIKVYPKPKKIKALPNIEIVKSLPVPEKKMLISEKKMPVSEKKMPVSEKKMSILEKNLPKMQIVNSTPESGKIILYYCNICDSCKHLPSERGHSNGYCKNLDIKYCSICGLGFGVHNYKEHRRNHLKTVLTLNHFQIISLSTGEKIEPPIPKFHCCKVCRVHFLTRKKLDTHKCKKETFKKCETCSKKFNMAAYTPHCKFHTVHDKNMPQLLKMYKSINSMWNVAYFCESCDLVTLTYDSAVIHSQNHINDIERPKSKVCEICDFDLTVDCYKSHKRLHEVNPDINRDKFRILQYDFRNLFKTDWMFMFSPLPKRHKFQILSESIYRYTRRLKLTCEIDNNTNELKIICKKCKTEHAPPQKCKFSPKYVCNECKLSFTNLTDFITHQNIHENQPKLYKVITFNDPKDEIFDQKLRDFANKSKSNTEVGKSTSKKLGVPTKMLKSVAKKYLYQDQSAIASAEITKKIRLFKCARCQSCLFLKKNITVHTCNEDFKRSKCYYCKELICSRHLNKHLEIHRQYPKLKTVVTYFNQPSKKQTTAIIFKCECGLHYTTKSSIDSHVENCDKNIEISTENCSKCDRLFPTDVLVNHLCKHHSKPMTLKVKTVRKMPIENNVPIKKNTPTKIQSDIENASLFECQNCHVIYANMNDFDEHSFYCQEVINKTVTNCEKCDRLFDDKCDHDCNDKNIAFVTPPRVSTVYRCDECNLSYFCRKSLQYHINRKHKIYWEIISCQTCGLRLTKPNIMWHEPLHNRKGRYAVKIINAEGNYTIIKGENFNMDEISNSDEIVDTSVAETTENSIESTRKRKTLDDSVVKSKLQSKKVKPVEAKTVIKEKSGDVYRLYKCTDCDVYFLTKKNYYYHTAQNHKMKRKIGACDICGLRFAHNVVPRHQVVHEVSKFFTIEAYDPRTGETKVLKGKNKVKTDERNKRKTQSDYTNAKSEKRRKNNDESAIDEIDADDTKNMPKIDLDVTDNDNLPNININIDMDPMNALGVLRYESDDSLSDQKTADQEPSTSKIDDKSVDGTLDSENNFSLNDNDSFTDKIAADNSANQSENISHRLKLQLNAFASHYSNKLYKCGLCGLHFLVENSLECHLKRVTHQTPLKSQDCEICNLKFTRITLIRHKYIHHTKMNLKSIEDYEISGLSKDVDSIEKKNKIQVDINNIDDRSKRLRKVKKYSKDVSTKINKSQSDMQLHYFKCVECNVCFLDKYTCKKHCTNHVLLDSKTYIECKICNFQFLIDSLKKHMKLHHSSEFSIDNLVISEYRNSDDSDMTIEVKRGIDNVQSRLVSTTTDTHDNSDE